MLHAGVIHLLSNGIVQLRVGAYLNVIYGTPRWLTIYILSGVFGNMCSCIYLTTSVGVGSSGALLGILCSWIVWIIFRWNKIPENLRGQRNCQLLIVVGSIVMTLAMSFSKYVDWSAHFGGSIQGILLGIVMLSYELDNPMHKKIIQAVALCTSITLFAVGFYYIINVIEPSRVDVAYWNQNDDWHRYPHGRPSDDVEA